MPPARGFTLDIDPDVEKICETSNSSSGHTRSVLYIIVIVNILSLIAVMNTCYFNWSKHRIDHYRSELRNLRNRLDTTNAIHLKQSLRDTIEYDSLSYTEAISSQNEHFGIVSIPLLSNSFDINDLSLVSGITFLILTIILSFTLTREISNLEIALHAITDRYPKNADSSKFPHLLKKELRDFNFKRRMHHYNFLSMNEIFNLPPLRVGSDGAMKSRIASQLIMKMFYFPFIIYSIIFINDLLTLTNGLTTHKLHTILSLSFSLLACILIYLTCRLCTRQKVKLYALYCYFYANKYRWAYNLPTRPFLTLSVVLNRLRESTL